MVEEYKGRIYPDLPIEIDHSKEKSQEFPETTIDAAESQDHLEKNQGIMLNKLRKKAVH